LGIIAVASVAFDGVDRGVCVGVVVAGPCVVSTVPGNCQTLACS